MSLCDWLSIPCEAGPSDILAAPVGDVGLGVDAGAGAVAPTPRHAALLDVLQRGCIVVGGTATLTTLKTACGQVVAGTSSLPLHAIRTAAAMHSMLRWFASTQVRNVATLAGNIATASPISDMNPLLVAAGAFLVAAEASDDSVHAPSLRLISLSLLFKSYRVTHLHPRDVIVAIVVPLTRPFEYLRAFKQARRREDDIALVGAAVRARLAPVGGAWTCVSATVALGGMGAVTLLAPTAAAALQAGPWGDASTVDSALAALRKDVTLPETVPGGV